MAGGAKIMIYQKVFWSVGLHFSVRAKPIIIEIPLPLLIYSYWLKFNSRHRFGIGNKYPQIDQNIMKNPTQGQGNPNLSNKSQCIIFYWVNCEPQCKIVYFYQFCFADILFFSQVLRLVIIGINNRYLNILT